MRLTTAARSALVCAALAALAVPLTGAATAAVDPGTEASIDPVNGAFELQGHGYGHGRGMSQWGAQGAATLGVPYEKILSTYYPGTELVAEPGKTRIGVALSVDNDGDLRVRPATGLEVVAGTLTKVLPAKLADAKVTTWRVRVSYGSLRLYGYAAGKWRLFKVGSKTYALTSPVRLRTPSVQVRLVLPDGSQRDYRGQAWAVADPKGVKGLRVVNNVPIDSYLRSVVPSESFPSWEPAALRAQAVAARTYALWKARNTHLGYADICDTTSCQVYHGRRNLDAAGKVTRDWETPTTDAAVAFTAGRRLEYGGAPALTEFSASNGGFSTTGDKPYLVAKADPWDGVVSNAAHSWTATVTAAKVRRAWPSLGSSVVAMRISERDGNGDWGGRVRMVELTGISLTNTPTSVSVSGPAFARAMGMRHPWFRGKPDSGGVVILKTARERDAEKSRTRETVDSPVYEASAGPVGPEQFETTPGAPPAG